ncbi:MAG: hypothetical protein ACOCWO_01345 [Candidatus Muiribacteriaceae bacterium]
MNKKKRFAMIFVRVFLVVFLIALITGGIVVRILGVRLVENDGEDINDRFADLYSPTDKSYTKSMKIAQSIFEAYSENAPDYVDEDVDFRSYWDQEDNRKNIEKTIEFIPEFDRLKPVLEAGKGISEGKNKFSFFRRLAKTLDIYTVYLLENREYEKALKVIDRNISASLILSYGMEEKPSLIEIMVGNAARKVILTTLSEVFAGSDTILFDHNIVLSSIPESFKKELRQKLVDFDRLFPDIKKAIEGEKAGVMYVVRSLYRQNPYKMMFFDMVFNPFGSTEKTLEEFYGKMIRSFETDEFSYEDVQKEYEDHSNPLVSMVVPNLQKAEEVIEEINQMHDKVISAL